jgi:tRNA nucleotidyltransferase (CCA-adding enzyme)
MAEDQFTVILTHEHTDFDALASMLGAHKLYPHAVPVLPRTLNRNLRDFLSLYRSALPFRRQEEVPRRHIDGVIVVDTQTFSTIRGMKPDTPGQIIDHHPLQRSLEAHWTAWVDEVGATTTLLVEEMAKRGTPVSPVEATLLLLGIYEDTGSLVYVTTTPRDLRAAAWLLERHVNLQVVHHFLHHPLTDAQTVLYGQLAENSQAYDIAGQSIIIATARAPEYSDEISTLAHKLRDVYDPAGLFLLVDLGDRVQFVARSTNDAVDVGAIALQFGGGGHARAAAALIRGQTLDQIKARLLALLQESVKPTVTVEQIMTLGTPVTVSLNATIGDMAGIVQRYGFEGYPVVDTDAKDDNGRAVARLEQLRGIITRRQVDRAQQHGLAAHPIQRYMHTGQVSVTPQHSVADLQRTMIESGWGQIPVVDPQTREIIGIVTRTDLIKLWGEPPRTLRREEIALRMESALPEPLLVVLRVAGVAAEELKYPLYAVGGFVRDLLLGRPNFDVDLVVEGDAIKLARLLAKRYGGRVRSHSRFGTAKWVLPAPEEIAAALDGARAAAGWDYRAAIAENGGRHTKLPATLDFVTARTEFYSEPSALPTVEHGSIKLDLHRRDFTINTLAIRLTPDAWGQLLDFYGGERDLRDGLVRVLHTHSFVDDPTRILRAVRFEQRFGFRIEQRTLELIENSLDLLAKVTPARVRHELELILGEEQPEQALQRLDQLGVTACIHHALKADKWVVHRFAGLRVTLIDQPPPQPIERLYFAVWTYRLSSRQLAELFKRLHPMRDTIDLLEDLHALKGRMAELERPDLAPSAIVHLLQPASEASRFLLSIITDSDVVRERLRLYEQQLRHVRPRLDGAALRRLGVPPGPIYRQILDATRDAWLDAQIADEDEERTMVRRLLAEAAV